MRIPFIAGNWKMHKNSATARDFAKEFLDVYKENGAQVCIAAPFTELLALEEMFAGTGVFTAAQNMHFEDEGAYTGEISGHMLKEIGVDFVIIGHSERRKYFGDTDEMVSKKARKAFDCGIVPIICCGETLEQREQGLAFHIVRHQVVMALAALTPEEVSGALIAYEPVWAIGTGRNASPQQAEEMCSFIRRAVTDSAGTGASSDVRILYGGSVKPDNAAALIRTESIDGALVGGASLDPRDFIEIINSSRQ